MRDWRSRLATACALQVSACSFPAQLQLCFLVYYEAAVRIKFPFGWGSGGTTVIIMKLLIVAHAVQGRFAQCWPGQRHRNLPQPAGPTGKRVGGVHDQPAGTAGERGLLLCAGTAEVEKVRRVRSQCAVQAPDFYKPSLIATVEDGK